MVKWIKKLLVIMYIVLITCISDDIPVLCLNLPAGKNKTKFHRNGTIPASNVVCPKL